MTADEIYPSKQELMAAVGLGNAVTPDSATTYRLITTHVTGGYRGYPRLQYRAAVAACCVGRGELLSYITLFHAN